MHLLERNNTDFESLTDFWDESRSAEINVTLEDFTFIYQIFHQSKIRCSITLSKGTFVPATRLFRNNLHNFVVYGLFRDGWLKTNPLWNVFEYRQKQPSDLAAHGLQLHKPVMTAVMVPTPSTIAYRFCRPSRSRCTFRLLPQGRLRMFLFGHIPAPRTRLRGHSPPILDLHLEKSPCDVGGKKILPSPTRPRVHCYLYFMGNVSKIHPPRKPCKAPMYRPVARWLTSPRGRRASGVPSTAPTTLHPRRLRRRALRHVLLKSEREFFQWVTDRSQRCLVATPRDTIRSCRVSSDSLECVISQRGRVLVVLYNYRSTCTRAVFVLVRTGLHSWFCKSRSSKSALTLFSRSIYKSGWVHALGPTSPAAKRPPGNRGP